MLTCREVAEVIASGELDRASWRGRLAVRFHLAMCVRCRRYARQIRAIGEAAGALFADAGEETERMARLAERILQPYASDESNG